MDREWYIKKMVEAHEKGDYKERNNYADMAGVDILEYFHSPTPPPSE